MERRRLEWASYISMSKLSQGAFLATCTERCHACCEERPTHSPPTMLLGNHAHPAFVTCCNSDGCVVCPTLVILALS